MTPLQAWCGGSHGVDQQLADGLITLFGDNSPRFTRGPGALFRAPGLSTDSYTGLQD
jgi:hypothetical protein